MLDIKKKKKKIHLIKYHKKPNQPLKFEIFFLKENIEEKSKKKYKKKKLII